MYRLIKKPQISLTLIIMKPWLLQNCKAEGRANLPSECRELLQRTKNITFDVEKSSEVFVELKETPNELLQNLYGSAKKEEGVTLNIPI